MSALGSSVPSVRPAATGDVPVVIGTKMPEPTIEYESSYFRKLASVAVPMMLIGAVTSTLFAGDVMAALGGVPSTTAATTVTLVLPVTPLRSAEIVVGPAVSADATPVAGLMLITAGFELLHEDRPAKFWLV